MTLCIILTGNRDYFQKCGFAANQLRATGFDGDIFVCSGDPVDDTRLDGVELKQIEIPDELRSTPTSQRLGEYAFWRLPAIEVLAQDYERIIYLDADIFAVGNNLDRLSQIDMQGAPVGAVYDFFEWNRPWLAPREFRKVGFEDGPYFNSGFLLVDSKSWLKRGLLQRILSMAAKYPHAINRADQSIINLALHSNWLELSPIWNWQYSDNSALLSKFVNPEIYHFVLGAKPWSSETGKVPKPATDAWKKYTGQLTDDHGEISSADLKMRNPVTFERLIRFGLYGIRLWQLKRRFKDPFEGILHDGQG